MVEEDLEDRPYPLEEVLEDLPSAEEVHLMEEEEDRPWEEVH